MVSITYITAAGLNCNDQHNEVFNALAIDTYLEKTIMSTRNIKPPRNFNVSSYIHYHDSFK